MRWGLPPAESASIPLSTILLEKQYTKNHSNADFADLRLSDDVIELLKSAGGMNNSLLCELTAHPDFPRLMADLEIYVNGVADDDAGADRRRNHQYPDSAPEQVSLAFICKRLQLNYKKLSRKKRNDSKRFRRSRTC